MKKYLLTYVIALFSMCVAAQTTTCISNTCNRQVQVDAKFCSFCGTAQQKKCPNCGTTATSANAKFCSSCGSSLSSAQNTNTGTFRDSRDGKTYKTVKIGNQTWMAENLAYKASSGCWAYDNNSSNVSKYGYLYDWETAKKVCPAGWHLPTDDEWKTLEQCLEMSISDANDTGQRGSIGYKFKSTSGWGAGGNGTNSSSFSALPGGYRNIDGTFYGLGSYGNWWSATEVDAECAWERYLYYGDAGVYRGSNIKLYGVSVRCVRD